jgi:hypothetical protein
MQYEHYFTRRPTVTTAHCDVRSNTLDILHEVIYSVGCARLRDKRTIRAINDDRSYMVEDMSADITEPATYEEAMASPEGREWKKAMDEEMDSPLENHTWSLVELPPGRTETGGNWVCKVKRSEDSRRMERWLDSRHDGL